MHLYEVQCNSLDFMKYTVLTNVCVDLELIS